MAIYIFFVRFFLRFHLLKRHVGSVVCMHVYGLNWLLSQQAAATDEPWQASLIWVISTSETKGLLRTENERKKEEGRPYFCLMARKWIKRPTFRGPTDRCVIFIRERVH